MKTVGAKIGAGYVIALVMLIVIGILSYRNTTAMIEGGSIRGHTYEVIEALDDLLSSLQNAETGQRGYLLVGEDGYLKPYRDGVSRVNSDMQRLADLISDNSGQEKRLAALRPLIADKMGELAETIDLMRTKGSEAALQIVKTNRGKSEMDDIRNIVGRMKSEEKNLLARRSEFEEKSARTTVGVVTYGIPLAIFVLSIFGLAVTVSITRELRDGIGKIAASSSEFLATTTQVASGAAETATAVSETTATVEEVKQTAQLSSQKARNVSDSAQKAAQVALFGKESVDAAIKGMQDIQEQMEQIARSVVRLSEQSQAISEIIVSVNDLAEQSNLLAVNAAIEANKAGEQGKGFVIVAQEIRSLAEQSRQATAQVRTILTDIQKGTSTAVLAAEQGAKTVESGVKQSRESGESIRKLYESIAEASQAATQIAASSQQQMVGMDQVAMAMENIKQASAQNVSGTRQAEFAAKGLHELGIRLGQMIGAKTWPTANS
ncbi:MAG: chemotaxis protein [Burkholderiales bacterium]|nr:chemotaxis protein [Burkholderiales bacterium]